HRDLADTCTAGNFRLCGIRPLTFVCQKKHETTMPNGFGCGLAVKELLDLFAFLCWSRISYFLFIYKSSQIFLIGRA
ncbi:hypothetical protein, partial [Paenibacillus elgii]|uniref:hypothetical protein n=1 Tax=Paenibacillus elgii TaxID=189691 RepID=UPI0005850E5C